VKCTPRNGNCGSGTYYDMSVNTYSFSIKFKKETGILKINYLPKGKK
jgi:hypothetical protein